MAATLLYQGHGSVRIVTGEGKVIYIDPFMGEGYDLPADIILMTHGHYDHTQVNLIATKNEGCTVIKWSDALKNGECGIKKKVPWILRSVSKRGLAKNTSN